jgi:DNA-binding PadR family transcriptional regulator
MPPRLIGWYALSVMERDGPLYGYRLAQRIAEKTEGQWRPGPGAIYPSLARLVERGLARSEGAGRRREYRITAAGRATLARVRRHAGPGGTAEPDLSALWAEIAGDADAGRFLVRRLERTTRALEHYLRGHPEGPGRLTLVREVDTLLSEARSSLRSAVPRRGTRRRGTVAR